MELKYTKDEKIDALMEIEQGDILQTKAGMYSLVTNIRVLAVVGDAIITEHSLSPMWSNRVYSAQQVHDMGCIVIKKS